LVGIRTWCGRIILGGLRFHEFGYALDSCSICPPFVDFVPVEHGHEAKEEEDDPYRKKL
jgi:hypothetical protein